MTWRLSNGQFIFGLPNLKAATTSEEKRRTCTLEGKLSGSCSRPISWSSAKANYGAPRLWDIAERRDLSDVISFHVLRYGAGD